MMSGVYTFEKTLKEYMEEFLGVLMCTGKPVNPSQVHREWAFDMEFRIKPIGWDALWKIPRTICEQLKIKYPATVCGTVVRVLFKELAATFLIRVGQDETVDLPAEYDVSLVDLWVIKKQSDATLDVRETAKCIDYLRFFYKHIWMAWDDDSNVYDWTKSHLMSRLHFYYDLKKKINPALVGHIEKLLIEATYLQQQKKMLENEVEKQETMQTNDNEETAKTNKSRVTKLMRIHLRLAIIKKEIELLENPETRSIFEDMNGERFNRFRSEHSSVALKPHPKTCVIPLALSTVDVQLQYLTAIRTLTAGSQDIQIFGTLQNCLEAQSFTYIFIPIGRHAIKNLSYFNATGAIRGVSVGNDRTSAEDICIESMDDDDILFAVKDDFCLENVTLDCRKVRLGLLLRKGCLTLKNCTLIGDDESGSSTGCEAFEGTTLIMINCTIKNFAVAIKCRPTVDVHLTETVIINADIGIDCDNQSVSLAFDESKIESSHYGIMYVCTDPNHLPAYESKRIVFPTLEDCRARVQVLNTNLIGNCEFANNEMGNICVVYHNDTIIVNMDVTDDDLPPLQDYDTIIVTDDSYVSAELVDDDSLYALSNL